MVFISDMRRGRTLRIYGTVIDEVAESISFSPLESPPNMYHLATSLREIDISVTSAESPLPPLYG